MAAISTRLCSELASYLNAQPLAIRFVAQRFNQHYVRAEEAKETKCYVTPIGIRQMFATRGSWESNYLIGLTIVRLVQTNLIAEEDELIELSEQIPVLLRDFRWRQVALTDVEDESARVLFETNEMETGFLFVAHISVTFNSVHN